jgi:hypothetical protein
MGTARYGGRDQESCRNIRAVHSLKQTADLKVAVGLNYKRSTQYKRDSRSMVFTVKGQGFDSAVNRELYIRRNDGLRC